MYISTSVQPSSGNSPTLNAQLETRNAKRVVDRPGETIGKMAIPTMQPGICFDSPKLISPKNERKIRVVLGKILKMKIQKTIRLSRILLPFSRPVLLAPTRRGALPKEACPDSSRAKSRERSRRREVGGIRPPAPRPHASFQPFSTRDSRRVTRDARRSAFVSVVFVPRSAAKELFPLFSRTASPKLQSSGRFGIWYLEFGAYLGFRY